MKNASRNFKPAADDKALTSTSSTLRHPEFQVRTDHCVDAHGRHYIRKMAVHREGRPHVAALVEHHARLADLCAGSRFNVNRCQAFPEGVGFEYLKGPTLAHVAAISRALNEPHGLMALLCDVFESIQSLARQPFVQTPAFNAVFGFPRLPGDLRSSAVTDIDLILPNIIIVGEQWNIIDYEWTFSFPIPVGYVLYRTLRHLFLDPTTARLLTPDMRASLLREAGISSALRGFRSMEFAFQTYASPVEALLRCSTSGTPSPLQRLLGRLPRAVGLQALKLQLLHRRTP